MTHLFLSPHLDDAILSCGGTIHRLVQTGQPVTVLTIMAGDPPEDPPDTPIVRDLHQRWQAGYHPTATRRQEDLAAAQSLGAQVMHLPVADCVYRTVQHQGEMIALYPSEESLFGEVSPDDPAFEVLRSLSLPTAEVIYVPLGVGYHVDHQLVRDWALTLEKTNGATLKFYEEYPYINDTMKIDRALAYYKAQTLRAEILTLSEEDVLAKIGGIDCYVSQISTWWDGPAQMAQATREIMLTKGAGQPAERFWFLAQ